MIDERKISALLRADAAPVRLPDDLLDRIRSEAAKPEPKRRWFRVALAGLAASLLVLIALPGVRAAATNAIRQVFHISGVEFVVHSGPDPAPPMGGSEPEELNPHPDSDHRYFYTPAGALSPEGVAAVKRLGEQFLLPTWLPDEMPKRLQLPLGGIDGEYAQISPYTLAIGPQMLVSARYPTWGKLEFQGTAQVDVKPVLLAGREALAVTSGDQLSYYLSIDQVGYIFRGPANKEAVLRQIAESLAQPHP